MKPIPYNANVLFVGKRGSGKTRRVKHFLRTRSRYIIVDFKREDFADCGVIVRGGVEQLRKALGAGHTRIVYQTDPREDARFEEMSAVAWFIYRELKDFLLVIDEMQAYLTKHKVPDGLATVLNIGRGRGLGVWGVTQRPQNVHNDFLEQVGGIFAHTLTGKAAEAVEFITAGRLTPDMLESLSYFHAWFWSDFEPLDACTSKLEPVPM